MNYKFKISWTTKDGTRVTDQIYTAEAVSNQLIHLEGWEATDITVEWIPPTPRVEVIYTGGGIWLACMNIDENIYAIVGNDCDECLNIYDRRGETPWDDEMYPCQNLVDSLEVDELGRKYLAIYRELKTALDKESF